MENIHKKQKEDPINAWIEYHNLLKADDEYVIIYHRYKSGLSCAITNYGYFYKHSFGYEGNGRFNKCNRPEIIPKNHRKGFYCEIYEESYNEELQIKTKLHDITISAIQSAFRSIYTEELERHGYNHFSMLQFFIDVVITNYINFIYHCEHRVEHIMFALNYITNFAGCRRYINSNSYAHQMENNPEFRRLIRLKEMLEEKLSNIVSPTFITYEEHKRILLMVRGNQTEEKAE